MAREVEEWVGKTEDTAIPPRVKDRILQRQTDESGVIHCALCEQPIDAKNRPIFDHITALVLAVPGQRLNREGNIHGIGARCCNPEKTAADVSLKSKVASVRRKHLGLDNKRSRFATSRDGKWKQKICGPAVRRDEEA